MPQLAAQLAQLTHLLLTLDTLGHDLEPQSLTQPDDGARQRRLIVAFGDVIDERFGDLHAIHRELPKVAQR